ncbi:MAG: phage Gp37/Gp68 family protein [Candidatus Bipolaricaulis sp.]|nr:phage Gp37/Gp68 family protein [Candidatus Bipolaricaulis sp.]
MAGPSRIEWTESSWNPVTGCTKASPGCLNCYAERLAKRLQAMGQPNYRDGFRVALHPGGLDAPLRWRRPQRIFVNSMSDLFHEDVPLAFIRRVFAVMEQADWHVFQALTKRAERLEELAECLPWPDNVWVGVSVENAECATRIEALRQVPAATRFISFEPLLGDVGTVDLAGIHWAIVGGESGPGARPMQPEWALAIRDQCHEQHVPFFFKQWGGVHKKKASRTLDGRVWDEYPARRTLLATGR